MKKKVTINLSEDAIKAIKDMAEKERRSISNMIEILILTAKNK